MANPKQIRSILDSLTTFKMIDLFLQFIQKTIDIYKVNCDNISTVDENKKVLSEFEWKAALAN